MNNKKVYRLISEVRSLLDELETEVSDHDLDVSYDEILTYFEGEETNK